MTKAHRGRDAGKESYDSHRPGSSTAARTPSTARTADGAGGRDDGDGPPAGRDDDGGDGGLRSREGISSMNVMDLPEDKSAHGTIGTEARAETRIDSTRETPRRRDDIDAEEKGRDGGNRDGRIEEYDRVDGSGGMVDDDFDDDVDSDDDANDDGLCEYERLRLERIARNNARLAELGFDDSKAEKKQIKRSAPPAQRRSVILDGPRRQNPVRVGRTTRLNELELLFELGLKRKSEWVCPPSGRNPTGKARRVACGKCDGCKRDFDCLTCVACAAGNARCMLRKCQCLQSIQGHAGALIDEVHDHSLPGLEHYSNDAEFLTAAEISNRAFNNIVDHHQERGTIAEAGTHNSTNEYTTREVVERPCHHHGVKPNDESERSQNLLDKLTHRRKLLACVRHSRIAAEERIRDICQSNEWIRDIWHEESEPSLPIFLHDVVDVETSTVLDEACPMSNAGTHPTHGVHMSSGGLSESPTPGRLSDMGTASEKTCEECEESSIGTTAADPARDPHHIIVTCNGKQLPIEVESSETLLDLRNEILDRQGTLDIPKDDFFFLLGKNIISKKLEQRHLIDNVLEQNISVALISRSNLEEAVCAVEDAVALVTPENTVATKRQLIRHNMTNVRITCECSKSRCLKLYCDCFQHSKICSPECSCVECRNSEAESGPHGNRTMAISAILKRRPDAFQKREKKHEGCNCKKTRCIKKYCICYNAGIKCNRSCGCKQCLNRDDEVSGETSLQVQEPTPKVLTKSFLQVEEGQPDAAGHQRAMRAQANNESDGESRACLTWDDGLGQLMDFKVEFGHVDPIVAREGRGQCVDAASLATTMCKRSGVAGPYDEVTSMATAMRATTTTTTTTTTTGKQHQPPPRPSLHAKPPSQQKQQQTQQPTVKPPQGKAIEAGNEHTGRWTKEEDGAFLLGLQMYGRQWKKVAAQVKTRTVVQTWTHAQKYFQKLSKGEGGGESNSNTSSAMCVVESMSTMPLEGAEIPATQQAPSTKIANSVVDLGGLGGGGHPSVEKKPKKRVSKMSTTASVSSILQNRQQQQQIQHHQHNPQQCQPPAVTGQSQPLKYRLCSSEAASGLLNMFNDRRVSATTLGSASATATAGPSSQQQHGFTTAATTTILSDALLPASASAHGFGFASNNAVSNVVMSLAQPAVAGGISIVDDATYEDMTQAGKFPEPSPAACGKRKMDEIAAAQMLAGVVGRATGAINSTQACVSRGASTEPATSLPSEPELSSALASGKLSSGPDFSDVVANTRESTDESDTHYEKFAEVDNLAAYGRPQKKRIVERPSYFVYQSDFDHVAPIASRKTTPLSESMKMKPPSMTSEAAIAKKKTKTIDARGGVCAMPNKYNLGHLKPLFDVGEEVYAAWWDDSHVLKDGTNASWFPGKVKSYREVNTDSPYGPSRFYDILYDDDDEIDGLEDYWVFSKVDYLLSMRNVGDSSWIGVRNETDQLLGKEDILWPRIVGWYVATIDGKDKSYSRLSVFEDALDAYDTSVIQCKGKGTSPTDLNRPEQWTWFFEQSDS
ncbi:hypothetical protein ACHAW5_006364 [Stephanodiscus triporus]|uniref:Uncharacterized protein n=1 Tax=Stephanodiscus triporus TaxID=2934178 RepID=A0ABD3MP64_9STRA